MKFSLPIVFLLSGLLFFSACESTGEKNNSPTTATPEKPTPGRPQAKLGTQTFGGLEVQSIQFSKRTFMGIRDKVSFADIQPFYAKNLTKIFTACQAFGLQMDGMPSGLFYEFNEEKGYADMAATIGVVAGKELGDGIEMITIPDSKALQIDYYGNYKGIARAHYAMEDYFNTNKIRQNENIPVIEEYITDPGGEPDPKKRLTRVTYFYD